MKYRWTTLGLFIWGCVGILQAQLRSDVLFRIGNTSISEAKAIETLSVPKDRKQKITIEEFNNVLNFYLAIHDFKDRGADTTKLFKRKLEVQTFTILGNIYSAENYDSIMHKCSVSRNSFAIVRDLFVPFEPILLQTIEKMRSKEKASFEAIAKYATAYEGTYLGLRIISPSRTAWSLNRAACELLKGSETQKFIGPVKDTKGYHYLQLIREQENFGRYKTQMIYISGLEGNGEKKIREAYKKLQSGVAFEAVARAYSQARRNDESDIVKYFSPSINTNEIIQEQLEKLTKNGAISPPFSASGGWYILKRLDKENYPLTKDLRKNALKTTRKPSFFIEELKHKYKVKEYPHNFMTGKDEILFLIGKQAYYTKDLQKYAHEYGYDFTIETYDRFFNHLLVERYKKELDALRYQKLIDDFYFLQIRNPMLMYGKREEHNKEKFVEDLRQLVKKYKPVIPNKKYVENNPVFED